MKKKNKNEILRSLGDYMEGGFEEVGKDMGLSVEANTIIKTKQGYLPQSVFLLQEFAEKLSYRTDYNVHTFRVLFYFISLSQFENFISIDVRTISENLNISTPSVKRATKKLTDDNIILKMPHPSDKRRIDYFLNPMAAWKGKTINRDKALSKLKNNKIQLDLF